MSKSNLMQDFGWFEYAKNLRDVAMNAENDNIASQKLVGHKPGKRFTLKTKQHLVETMSKTVPLCAPELIHGDTHACRCV